MQDTYAQKTHKGFSFELGRTALPSSGIKRDQSKPTLGFGMRGFIQKPINKQFNVKAAAALYLAGDKFEDFKMRIEGHNGDFDELRYRMGYLSLAILAQFHTKKKILQFYGSIGPEPSFMLFVNGKAPSGTPCIIYTDTEFRRMQLNITGKLGIQVQYSLKKRLLFSLIASSSMHNIVKTGPATFYNQHVFLSVGHSVKL